MPSDCTIHEYFPQLAARHGSLPLSADVELTSVCNNQCVHCYVLKASDYAPVHMPTALVMDLLGAAQEEGTLLLSLTGGEPLVHPDFESIYRTAVTSGFVVAILTNGTLIDEGIADLFVELLPWRLSITVYGATEETYTAVTRNPSGYQALLQGLELLAVREVPFRLKFVALRENYHELDQFIRLTEQYDVPYQVDGAVTPAQDGSRAPLAHRLSAAELACMELSIPEAREVLSQAALSNDRAEGDRVFQCAAGLNRFFVDALGRVSVCIEEGQSWPLDRTDVRGSLHRIFCETFPVFLRQGGLAEECQECELWPLCQRCAAWRYKEVGDRGKPVEFFCELARQRAALLSADEDMALAPATALNPGDKE